MSQLMKNFNGPAHGNRTVGIRNENLYSYLNASIGSSPEAFNAG